MNELFRLLLSLSLSASFVMVLIFAADKLFKKRLDYSWHYYIWLVVIIRLLIPYAPETNMMNLIIQENRQPVVAGEVIQTPKAENTPVILPQAETPIINADTTPEKNPVGIIDIMWYLWVVWAVVAVSMFACKVISYMQFARLSTRGRKRIGNPAVINIYQSAIRTLNLRRAPLLYKSRIAGVPMLIGLFRPYILIPDSQIDEQSLRHILLHELTHYKRHDGFYKWLVQIVVCIHWFNPLVYLMAKEIDKACELSCDEAVLRRLSRSERRGYGEMLLSSLQYSIEAPGRVMTLPLSKDGRLMKTRLNAIMNFRHIGMGGIIISLLITMCIATGAAFAGVYPTQANNQENIPIISGDRIPSGNSDQQNTSSALRASNNSQSIGETLEAPEYSDVVDTKTDETGRSQILEKPFAKELEEMWPWIESLDKDIYSGYYRQPSGIILQVTDVAAFRQSPAMKEAQENGWVFDLQEVRYSANEIDALITKIQFWDRRQELQISTVGASQDKSTMSIGTTSLTAQNRAIIEEFVGIGPLEFYNPEIVNETAGTGEYRMLGLDGIIEWYIPRLFDKPFVYNILVSGPSMGAFSNGDTPDWNFYLQYESATTDEQMAEQIENKLLEWYDTRYDANAISYTIEPVPVERVE